MAVEVGRSLASSNVNNDTTNEKPAFSTDSQLFTLFVTLLTLQCERIKHINGSVWTRRVQRGFYRETFVEPTN